MKTYLFVTEGTQGFVKPEYKCQAENETLAKATFEDYGLHMCMNTAIVCVDDIPDVDEECGCGCDDCESCYPSEPDDSMDGDAASALASAGFGTDEDYYPDSPVDDGIPFGE